MKKIQNSSINFQVPCENTVNGKCEKKDSIQDCMETCKKPDCYWGLWNDENKTCTAVYYPFYKEINPGFNLVANKPQETVFIDTTFFQYPAERRNRIFYYDRVKLQNVETGYILEPQIRLRMSKPPLPIKALEVIPIYTKSPVLFYNRDIDSVLRVENDNVNWYKSIEFSHEDYEAFFLEPYNKDVEENNMKVPNEKKEILYTDIFRIRNIFNQYIRLPTMYQIIQPRLNDLITSNEDTPDYFRFIYIPPSVDIKKT